MRTTIMYMYHIGVHNYLGTKWAIDYAYAYMFTYLITLFVLYVEDKCVIEAGDVRIISIFCAQIHTKLSDTQAIRMYLIY